MSSCQPAMHREKWDEGEIEFLRQNLWEHDIPWISKKLRRTRASVTYRISKLGLELGPWGLNRSWNGLRGRVPRPSEAQLKRGVRLVNLFTFAEYVMTGARRGETGRVQVEVAGAVYGDDGRTSNNVFWVFAHRVALVSIFQQWYPKRNIERRERIRAKHAAQLRGQDEIGGRQGESRQGHARV